MNDERSSRPPVFDNSKSQSRAGPLRKRFPRTKPTPVAHVPNLVEGQVQHDSYRVSQHSATHHLGRADVVGCAALTHPIQRASHQFGDMSRPSFPERSQPWFPRTKPTPVSPNEANLGFPERSQPRIPRTKPMSSWAIPERSQPRFPRTKPTTGSETVGRLYSMHWNTALRSGLSLVAPRWTLGQKGRS